MKKSLVIFFGLILLSNQVFAECFLGSVVCKVKVSQESGYSTGEISIDTLELKDNPWYHLGIQSIIVKSGSASLDLNQTNITPNRKLFVSYDKQQRELSIALKDTESNKDISFYKSKTDFITCASEVQSQFYDAENSATIETTCSLNSEIYDTSRPH